MNTATRKAKGKRLQKYICNLILKVFPSLSEKDVTSIRMGRPGEDIQLSNIAKKNFPYSIECKNQERMQYLWSAYGQAMSNAKGLEPIVALKINQKKPLILVDAEYFINLHANINISKNI